MGKIDVSRCRKAMEHLSIEGYVETKERKNLIEEVIRDISTNPVETMARNFFGLKNYAAFGDQRADCAYGMGPRHGSIVFRIGRPGKDRLDGSPPALGGDHIYLLECVRDFGNFFIKTSQYGDPIYGNLTDAIKELDAKQARVDQILRQIEGADIDTHVE